MLFSYDPPEQSLADLMSKAIDESEEDSGCDPTRAAAEYLHTKLLLHGQRHHLDADSATRDVVLRMPTSTALWLASLVAEQWKARGT